MSVFGSSGTASGLDTQRGEHWSSRAACIGRDPEMWFPLGDAVPGILAEAEAKVICNECPVRAQCATDALTRELSDGIYGGLTQVERAALLKDEWREGDELPEVQQPRCARGHLALGNMRQAGNAGHLHRVCDACKREDNARDYLAKQRPALLAEMAAAR